MFLSLKSATAYQSNKNYTEMILPFFQSLGKVVTERFGKCNITKLGTSTLSNKCLNLSL